jgi:hypothetical protein
MPPRLSRITTRLPRTKASSIDTSSRQLCPICTFSRELRRPSSRKSPKLVELPQLPYHRISRRRQTIAHGNLSPRNSKGLLAREQLRDALQALQRDAPSFVNISRLQLALRGLQQPEGEETIRIAILSLADGGVSSRKAKQLARVLLADPLKPEEEWERTLLADDASSRPILLRVGQDGAEESGYSSRMVQELHVSSAALKNHRLEILVLETDLPQTTIGERNSSFEALLVPTMEIPVSSTGRYTPVTTPVHKSLIVGSGISGAASLFPVAISGTDMGKDIVRTAVNIKVEASDDTNIPFQTLDLDLADSALASFRQTVNNALDYEHKWFASGTPDILEWMKLGTLSMEGQMKPPLRLLVESVLETTNSAIQEEKSRRLSAVLTSKVSDSKLDSLRESLSEWSEDAHTELRDHLDIAFGGHRWRKLGWWKLFWRVDDVSMIATDILSRRFLIDAEQELIFLAGRFAEAGVLKKESDKLHQRQPGKARRPAATFGSAPRPPRIKDMVKIEDGDRGMKDRNWPLDITVARGYLSSGTVPALQALAQKLVLQTLTTSSFASGLAALTYVSTISTGLYEAGAVAALGIVYSMRRMQVKWERAREYWEGEVREEGRKSVRHVESIVGDVLKSSDGLQGFVDAELDLAEKTAQELERALEAYK